MLPIIVDFCKKHPDASVNLHYNPIRRWFEFSVEDTINGLTFKENTVRVGDDMYGEDLLASLHELIWKAEKRYKKIGVK